MNKQLIVELRRQAGDLGAKEIRIYDLSQEQMTDIFMEKFTEAIVKECIKVAGTEMGYSQYCAMREKIEEHFGVK